MTEVGLESSVQHHATAVLLHDLPTYLVLITLRPIDEVIIHLLNTEHRLINKNLFSKCQHMQFLDYMGI